MASILKFLLYISLSKTLMTIFSALIKELHENCIVNSTIPLKKVLELGHQISLTPQRTEEPISL